MTTRVRSVLATFGWWQWTLTAVFVVALLVTGMFAARTVSYSIYWRLHHREPIERWMPIGYLTGRLAGRRAGRRAVDAFARRFERADAIRRAEAFSARWGAPGIFFTRWLVTALGPWINLSSGVAAYSWPKFLVWDILGESIWVLAYVSLGRLFHDRIQDLADLLTSIG